MSELVTRNGKMYKQVPCYDDQGELFQFILVEVASGPVVPPESVFEEPETPAQETFPEENVVDSMEETTSVEAAETSTVEEQSETQEEVPTSDELIVDSMTMQKTIEDTDVVASSDDEDAASSSGSTSVDRTEESESEMEDKVVEEKTREQLYPVQSTLDEYDFDDNLRTSDGFYLTNVDGKHVWNFDDISEMQNDGGVRRLLFQKTPSKVQRKEHNNNKTQVCFRPLYKTLKKVQVRSGPGSKFEATGVIGANEEVVVIQEGLLECDLGLVESWMQLHLPQEMVTQKMLKSFRRRNRSGEEQSEEYEYRYATFEDHIDNTILEVKDTPMETYVSETFDEDEQNVFRKAFTAANRKVKVMYKENGITKYGWISKRKNSGVLIRRLYGKSTPTIVVSNIQALPTNYQMDRREELEESFEGSILVEAMKFIDSNTKNTTVKFTNFNGKKIESVEKHNCKPKMSFYENLAKSAISGIIGTKKPRFNIEWDAQFRSDRFRGLEKQTMMVDGKSRMRTGYFVPDDEFIVTFQRLSDAVTFYNSEIDNTCLTGADLEWDQTYTNLQPVDAKVCPEYLRYTKKSEKFNCERSEEAKRSEYLRCGISYITL